MRHLRVLESLSGDQRCDATSGSFRRRKPRRVEPFRVSDTLHPGLAPSHVNQVACPARIPRFPTRSISPRTTMWTAGFACGRVSMDNRESSPTIRWCRGHYLATARTAAASLVCRSSWRVNSLRPSQVANVGVSISDICCCIRL